MYFLAIFLIGGFYSERYEQLVNQADWDVLIIGLLVTSLVVWAISLNREDYVQREVHRYHNPARDEAPQLTRDHWNEDL
jgi:hypothetical protein